MGLSLKEALAYYWQHITAKLDERLTIDPEVTEEGAANLINADSLGGVLASEYALKEDLSDVSIALDSTLTLEGTAADAAAVGTALEGKVNKAGDTMTGPLTITGVFNVQRNNNYPTVNFSDTEGNRVGCLQFNASNGNGYIVIDSVDSDYYDLYNFPERSSGLTANKYYHFLTTKSPVTIEQGGTGATSARTASVNLLRDTTLTTTTTPTANYNGIFYTTMPDTAAGTGDITAGSLLHVQNSVSRGFQIAAQAYGSTIKWRGIHSGSTSDAGTKGYKTWYTIYHSGNIDTLMTEITNRLSNASGVSF